MAGACPFSTKALNAQRSGAQYAVIYNTADVPTIGSMACTGGQCQDITIPVLFVTFGEGAALKAARAADVTLPPAEQRVAVHTATRARTRARTRAHARTNTRNTAAGLR